MPTPPSGRHPDNWPQSGSNGWDDSYEASVDGVSWQRTLGQEQSDSISERPTADVPSQRRRPRKEALDATADDGAKKSRQNRKARVDRRSEETPDAREKRRTADRLAYAARRDKETPEAKRARLDAHRIAQIDRRSKETPDAREKRRTADRLAYAARRDKETPEAWEKWLEVKKLPEEDRWKGETPDARTARQGRNRLVAETRQRNKKPKEREDEPSREIDGSLRGDSVAEGSIVPEGSVGDDPGQESMFLVPEYVFDVDFQEFRESSRSLLQLNNRKIDFYHDSGESYYAQIAGVANDCQDALIAQIDTAPGYGVAANEDMTSSSEGHIQPQPHLSSSAGNFLPPASAGTSSPRGDEGGSFQQTAYTLRTQHRQSGGQGGPGR